MNLSKPRWLGKSRLLIFPAMTSTASAVRLRAEAIADFEALSAELALEQILVMTGAHNIDPAGGGGITQPRNGGDSHWRQRVVCEACSPIVVQR
jgi:hypothetical protein